jgi:hypothetical protein
VRWATRFNLRTGCLSEAAHSAPVVLRVGPERELINRRYALDNRVEQQPAHDLIEKLVERVDPLQETHDRSSPIARSDAMAQMPLFSPSKPITHALGEASSSEKIGCSGSGRRHFSVCCSQERSLTAKSVKGGFVPNEAIREAGATRRCSQFTHTNERPVSRSGRGRLNGRDWVFKAESIDWLSASRLHRRPAQPVRLLLEGHRLQSK